MIMPTGGEPHIQQNPAVDGVRAVALAIMREHLTMEHNVETQSSPTIAQAERATAPAEDLMTKRDGNVVGQKFH